MVKVLITGVNGFLGSHLAEYLLHLGYEVYALVRRSSDMTKCNHYLSKISFIYWDDPNLKNQIWDVKPDFVVHTAWIGVISKDRSAVDSQKDNVNLMLTLLDVLDGINLRGFICFGSQAEYGVVNEVVNEECPLHPTSMYGISKVLVSSIFEFICNKRQVNWYWLRIFSVFGERESEDWLIPSTLRKLLSHTAKIDLTAGDQKYAYLYIDDFVKMISKFLQYSPPIGYYNISANNAVSLKDIVSKLKALTGSETILNFGALPYRQDQSFLIQGDMSKFNRVFGYTENTPLDLSLQKLINSYNNEGF